MKGAADRVPPFFWHAIPRAHLQYPTANTDSEESHATRHHCSGGKALPTRAPRYSPSQPGAAGGAISMALPDLFRRVNVVPTLAALARRFSSAHVPRYEKA